MIPRHCREVAVKRVSFPLTERNVLQEASGKLAYAATSYMVLNNGADWMVLNIHRAKGSGLFRNIENVGIVSVPRDTAFLEAPQVDVQNPSVMVGMAEQTGKEALVVKGKFEHISFVCRERTTPLVVFDVVPPDPPKIVELVEAALNTGRIRKPIKIIPRIMDLNELAKARNTRYVMFPCYALTLAGLEGGQKTLYLDQAQALNVPVNEITLIGCDLSIRVFTSIYGARPAFMELCPKKRAHTVAEACLCRCCIVDEGHGIEGNAAFVPWGASVADVEEALIDLFRLEVDQAPKEEDLPNRLPVSEIDRSV